MTDFIFRQIERTTLAGAAVTMGAALVCGIIIAIVYRIGAAKPSKFMMITAIIMPSIVHMIIMMVNGSIGAGVAVAGAFSLVRFRSIPGSSRDICILFLAMATGLAMGMGYVGYGLAFTVIIAAVILIAEKLIPSEHSKKSRLLRIFVAEDMDYSTEFDDIFTEFTSKHTLTNVKTVKMGTMFALQYIIIMKDPSKEKEMIDKIRCRNGNLTVSCGIVPVNENEL